MRKILILSVLSGLFLSVNAQSVIRYVSNTAAAINPPSCAFLDSENNALTVTSNTYSDGQGRITLSGDVAKFADGALYGMDLLYVTVPATVTEIGDNAFSYCKHLQAVLFESATVPAEKTVTNGYKFSSSNMTIYVPNESYSLYNTEFGSIAGVTYICCWQDITLNSSGIGTFGDPDKAWEYYSTYEKNIGLTAYKCSAFNESTITFDKANATQDGSGVVIKGEANATYRLLETKVGLDPQTNYMIAADGETITDASGKYILTNGTRGIGFYPLKNGTSVAKGKAYLDLGKTNDAKYFVMEFNETETTGISDAQCSKSDTQSCIYNLAGQAVGSDYKGIVIINGKKYIR